MRRDGTLVTTLAPSLASQPAHILTFLCISRADCGNWAAGNYTFDVSVNGVSKQATGTLQLRNGLRILAVPIKVKDRGIIKELPDDQWKTAWRFLSQVYPIANDGIIWTLGQEFDATRYDLTEPEGCGVINSGTCKLWSSLKRLQPIFCGWPGRPPCYDKIVGFIPPMPTVCNLNCGGTCTCWQGWTRDGKGDIRTANVVMANGSFESPCPDRPTVKIDYMRAIVAHEVGHNYGFGEEYNNPRAEYECNLNPPPPNYIGSPPGLPNCNSGYKCVNSPEEPWPFESGTGSLIRSEIYHPFELYPTLPNVPARGPLGDMLSFMGNGTYQKDIWVTPRVYDYLFDQLTPTTGLQTFVATSENVVLASGFIGRNNIVHLDPWYQHTTSLNFSTEGSYTIEAVDAISQTLASQGFNVSYVLDNDPPQEIMLAPFEVAVAFPTSTKAFRIKRDDTLLKVIPVSPNPPTTTVTAPSYGQAISGLYTITWQASDLDRDQLYHIVQYSHDGQSWRVLTNPTTETHFTVNFDTLPGGDQARITVITTDGVNTTETSSSVLSVDIKPPEVFIESPSTNTRYESGMNIILSGSAYDLQDEWLRSDLTLEWSSNRDGGLGRGELLNLQNLSIGQHIITLSATNRYGMTSSATTTISIGSEIYLPLISRKD